MSSVTFQEMVLVIRLYADVLQELGTIWSMVRSVSPGGFRVSLLLI